MPSPTINSKKPVTSDAGNVWLRRACWTLLILVIISFVLMIFWPQMYEEKEWQMWYNDTPKKKSRVGAVDNQNPNGPRFECYYSKSCPQSMEQLLPALTEIVSKEHPEITLDLISCDDPQCRRLCDGGDVPRLVYRATEGARGIVYEGPLQYHTVLYWINEMVRSQA